MVAMRELHLDEPPTIHSAEHGMRSGIPSIEIAYQINRLRGRSGTIEIDWLRALFCQIRIGGAFVKHSVHQAKVTDARKFISMRMLIVGSCRNSSSTNGTVATVMATE